jgi:hypothetical protein
MKLPNAENAIVEDSKIFQYLLSHYHRDGKHKAKFFRMHGYSDELAELLRTDLIELANRYPVDEIIEQFDGVKYVIHGEMKAPNGSILRVRTVWFIRAEEDFPRFVTAYPQ